MKRAKKMSGILHAKGYAPGEEIPLTIVHPRFKFLTLRKAVTAGRNRIIAYYGMPRNRA